MSKNQRNLPDYIMHDFQVEVLWCWCLDHDLLSTSLHPLPRCTVFILGLACFGLLWLRTWARYETRVHRCTPQEKAQGVF